MKLHAYVRTKVVRSPHWLGAKHWRYHVTACGLEREADDFHADAAKNNDAVTCSKCRKNLGLG